SRFGRTLHLSSAKMDDLLGKAGAAQVTEDDSANSLVVEQLGILEVDNRHVLYQTDADDSAWTRRSVRQADHILLLGRGSATPERTAIERLLERTAAAQHGTHMSLVLLHDDGSRRPSGTTQWLTERRVERHFHVRLDRDADFERLARVLTGHAVG